MSYSPYEYSPTSVAYKGNHQFGSGAPALNINNSLNKPQNMNNNGYNYGGENFSLYDMSIATSQIEAVRKVRDERRLVQEAHNHANETPSYHHPVSSPVSPPHRVVTQKGSTGGVSSVSSWDAPSLWGSPSAASAAARSNFNNNEFLDDPNFAPPPILNFPNLKSNHAVGSPTFEKFPSYEKIRHSGHIMTRLNDFDILTKKWCVRLNGNRCNLPLLYCDV